MTIFFAITFLVIAAGAGILSVRLFRKNSQKSVSAMLALVVAIGSFVSFIFIPFGIKTVQTGEMAVVKEFGEAVRTERAGLHFINIISTTYDVYDVRTQQTDATFFAYSSDGQSVKVSVSSQFALKQDKLLELHTNVGTLDSLKSKIANVSEEKVKIVMASKSAMDIIANRQVLSTAVMAELKTFEDQYFVFFENFVVVDIEFDEKFENAVEQKMIAEQEKMKAEFDMEKAIIKAKEQFEVTKKQAEGALEVAKSEAAAEVEIAKAQAQAIELIKAAWENIDEEIRKTMLQELFYQKWNGILPEVMAGDSLDLIFGIGSTTP